MTEVNLLSALGSGPVIKRFILTKADFTAGSTSQTYELQKLPKGSIVQWVRIKHDEACAATGLTGATVEVGSKVANDTDLFASPFDVSQSPADDAVQISSGAVAGTYGDDTVTATLKTSGANINALTAGVINIDICYWYMTSSL